MSLSNTIRTWDYLGGTEPLWAILNDKHKKNSAWDKDEFFKTGEEEIGRIMADLGDLGIKPANGTAVDFGCGAGRLTLALGRFFDTVIGIDAAPSMIALAGQFNPDPKKYRYVLNQKDDLALLPDNSVDFIYSSITLQHMEPAYAHRYIREFVRLLRPAGGALVFQLPSRRLRAAPASRTRRMRPDIIPAPLLRLYRRLRYGKDYFIEMYGTPREDVTALLARSGASIRDIRENNDAGDDWESLRYYAAKN